MINYPIREGLEFVLRYVRRDALCNVCGKNDAWARQRINRYAHNNGDGFYYFSRQDCDIINNAMPELARRLETISIPKTHGIENAEDARFEIECMLRILKVGNLQKDLGYNKARWHDRIRDDYDRYWFTPDELKMMREHIKKVCQILRNVQVEYEEI